MNDPIKEGRMRLSQEDRKMLLDLAIPTLSKMMDEGGEDKVRDIDKALSLLERIKGGRLGRPSEHGYWWGSGGQRMMERLRSRLKGLGGDNS